MNASNIDALIARIKAEAANLADDAPDANVSRNALEGEVVRLPAVTLPGAHAGAGQRPARGAGSNDVLYGLYGIADDAFVEEVYRLVMQREADATGMRHYLDALDAGASRIGIAATLRLSPEGRARGVWVPGFAIAIPLAAAQRVLRRFKLDRIPAALLRRYDRHLQLRADKLQALPKAVHGLRIATQKAFASWQRPLQTISSLVVRHDRGLQDLQQRVKTLEAELAVAREDAQYLRQVAVRNEGARQSAAPSAPALVSDDMIAAYYVAFENANRGTLAEIRAKLAIYEDWIEQVAAMKGPVLDIGCGRGEWLQLLGEHGIQAGGIDTNPVMIDLCRSQGLKADTVDALTCLRAIPDNTLAAVTSFHVIEHLPFDYLYAMVAEIRRVLAPGGRLLFETPNPENVLVGSHTFYHDFSHRNPVTPTAIRFLLSYHGFDEIDLVRSSPYPQEARVPGDDPLTERVNGHLCGPQDYAVVACKPLVRVQAKETAEARS
ncbi:class I SAM-dependent methyltransferase [Paracidovorax citrulli]